MSTEQPAERMSAERIREATKNGMEIAYLATVKGWQELHDNAIIRNRELKLERDAAIAERKQILDRIKEWESANGKGPQWGPGFEHLSEDLGVKVETLICMVESLQQARDAAIAALTDTRPCCGHLGRFHDPIDDDTHSCSQCALIASNQRAWAAIAERDALLVALKELRDAVKKVPEMNKQTYDALGIFVNRVIANAEKAQSNGTK